MTGDPFQPWHDFYALIGTASATLVGLMFVAASVGTGFFTHERQAGLRTFLSPTVVAFSVVLASSMISLMPMAELKIPSALIVAIGTLGMLYSWQVWRTMVRDGIHQKIDLEDRIWYTLVPAASYVLLASAGVMLNIKPHAACAVIAGGVCLLLLAGLRNAWDITTWVVLSRKP